MTKSTKDSLVQDIHLPFPYIQSYYRREIFPQKAMRRPAWQEWAALIAALASLVLFIIFSGYFTNNVNLGGMAVILASFILMLVLFWNLARVTQKYRIKKLDEEASGYLEQKVNPLRDFLKAHDYYDQHHLRWMIDACTREIEKGSTFEAGIKRIGTFGGNYIWPIITFCIGILAKDLEFFTLLTLALTAIITLFVIYLLVLCYLPLLSNIVDKEYRSLTEMRESAEYLLAEVLTRTNE